MAVIAARLMIWVSGAKLKLSRVKSIHSCEQGSVQSLGFVLTLPFFLMIIMLIVQASHLMIANIIVQYSAFATVRSAAVWIPASLASEDENEISQFSEIGREGGDVQYRIFADPDSPKFNKIASAAVLSCFSLGPSRDLGYQLTPEFQVKRDALAKLYQGLDAEAYQNTLFETRVHNKLAYTIANTSVDLTFWHRRNGHYRFKEPPLQVQFGLRPEPQQYSMNELGWQDHLTAKVTYQLPLLPGPVRLFAPQARDPSNENPLVDQSGETYIWTLSAQATMGIEGEIPLYRYRMGADR
jgi:hypothetical protein